MHIIREPGFRQLAEQVHTFTNQLERSPEHDGLWRQPTESIPKQGLELVELFYKKEKEVC